MDSVGIEQFATQSINVWHSRKQLTWALEGFRALINIGALTSRIGFWGIISYMSNQDLELRNNFG